MAVNLDSIGKTIGPVLKEYDWKDLVLYALGVGAGFDELEYVFEQKLKAIPSYSIASVFDFLAQVALESRVNLAGILHGEQDIIFHAPLPTSATLSTEGHITHIYDKGADKGALVVAEAETRDGDGNKLFTNIFTIFARKDGGFGGENAPSEPVSFPDREPDFVEAASPSPDQPLLYRLSGDIFVLHVDPDFAKSAGFDRPIMHGLCTHGYACRAVIKHLFPGEPERMTRFRVRFSRTLYPGIPIATQIWKESDGKALFRTINADTGEVVIDRGVVEWCSAEEAKKRASRKGIRFDDRVAVVTGAGAGLGKAYALELGRRGAKVVVNDLGGARDGTGASTKAADAVVDAIIAEGGEAVASYDSVATVEGGQAIVDKAIEAFGRVDILINNAGILRDKSFVKTEPEHWDAVLKVHLDGAYNVTRPAFLKMKEQGYGRIVMTSSAAGLFGNFGQTNYAAAKMGQVGLMNTLRLEGERYDIKVNCVAPLAATRLTEDILPPDMAEKLEPERVAPLVLFLTSEQCPVTGHIYGAGAGFFHRIALVTGPGAKVDSEGEAPPAPEAVEAAWKAIASLEDPEEYRDAMASLQPMIEGGRKVKKKAAAGDGGPGDGGGAGASGGGGAGERVAKVFERMPDAFVADEAEGVEVTFQYRITGDGGGEWYAVIADKTCEVAKGEHDAPTTTIIMESADFVDLIEGKLDAMAAYTGGKLKIEGDLMKSQLIQKLFKF